MRYGGGTSRILSTDIPMPWSVLLISINFSA